MHLEEIKVVKQSILYKTKNKKRLIQEKYVDLVAIIKDLTT